MDFILVLCTINEMTKAKEIAKIVVEEKLAACVNIIPQVVSIYSWQNEIVDDNELLMVIKTEKRLFESLKNRIVLLHPYDICEVISIPINDGAKQYLEWLKISLQ